MEMKKNELPRQIVTVKRQPQGKGSNYCDIKGVGKEDNAGESQARQKRDRERVNKGKEQVKD